MEIQRLRDKIREKEMALARLVREQESLTLQLDAYRDALSIVSAPEKELTVDSSSQPASSQLSKSRGRPKSPISLVWAHVLLALSTAADPVFDYKRITEVGRLKGITMKDASIRTQMKFLVDDGFLDRVANGQFKITHKGELEIRETLAKNDGHELLKHMQSVA